MNIFGIDVTFSIFRAPGKNYPVVPFQFDGARPPRTHAAQYAVVALVLSLLAAALFLVGFDLTNPVP